jgi:cytochrome c
MSLLPGDLRRALADALLAPDLVIRLIAAPDSVSIWPDSETRELQFKAEVVSGRFVDNVIRLSQFAATLLFLGLSQFALAAGDPARGAQLFRQCAACHSTIAGEHLTGPSLASIWKRKAGTVQGFRRYSDALQHANLIWDEKTLDKWLANPEALVAGTTMTFPGLPDNKARDDVIAYLQAVTEGKAPREALPGGGMMMGMGSSRTDLKRAPPEGQVTAIRHCGDTYSVSTADGKTNKVWEFNLRFKTDTSELGPERGKPVIIGAGMQGDRASIVFAAPREMSDFIKEECH